MTGNAVRVGMSSVPKRTAILVSEQKEVSQFFCLFHSDSGFPILYFLWNIQIEALKLRWCRFIGLSFSDQMITEPGSPRVNMVSRQR